MSLIVEKSPQFHTDVINQFGWYEENAGEERAWQFFKAVDTTVLKLARQTGLGRRHRFRDARLRDVWSCQVQTPFCRFLIFYRFDGERLDVWRLMHGARDLPRRLTEPSETI